MKRSEINAFIKEATEAFEKHGWSLPPNARWDVTDFGLGDFSEYGLLLVNLAEQAEYCEKLMYARKDQKTPMHYHASKKEDIICRWGKLAIKLKSEQATLSLQVNGELQDIAVDSKLVLNSGERITLVQGTTHEFWPESEYAIVGEVSTANNDLADNFFENSDVGRYSQIAEDEEPIVKLVSD